MLFWAPGLYVPESEFRKWCNAFGRGQDLGKRHGSELYNFDYGQTITVHSNLI